VAYVKGGHTIVASANRWGRSVNVSPDISVLKFMNFQSSNLLCFEEDI